MGGRILPLAVGKTWIVVLVASAFGHKPVQKRGDVIPQGVLHLSAKYPRGGMEGGDHTYAVPYTGLGEELLDCIGQVKELRFLDGIELNSFGFDQHRSSPPSVLTGS